MKQAKILIILLGVCILLTTLLSCDSSSNKPSTNTPTRPSTNTPSGNIDQQEKPTEKEPEVTNIYLSKSELDLGIGDTAKLTATVSPGNAKTTLTWSSSDKNIAEVDNQGIVTAKNEGFAVIKVVADNGILAVCNVDVRVKTGSVAGVVTYKYNQYVGNRADVGSIVMLISTSVTSLTELTAFGDVSRQPEGCYATQVDGSGEYRMDDIPVGEYYLIILSENTTSASSDGEKNWGSEIYSLFEEDALSAADINSFLHQVKTTKIVIQDGKVVTFSHDFGYSHF